MREKWVSLLFRQRATTMAGNTAAFDGYIADFTTARRDALVAIDAYDQCYDRGASGVHWLISVASLVLNTACVCVLSRQTRGARGGSSQRDRRSRAICRITRGGDSKGETSGAS